MRVAAWIVLAVVLLALGFLLILYSPWGQNRLRESALSWINSRPGIEAKIDNFSLIFPLGVDIDGLQMVQNGDTVLAAGKLQADVALMPLLRGTADIDRLFISEARMQMGNPDSLMMMVIKADTLDIAPARVTLSSMDIDLKKGLIAGALVSLTSRVDSASTPVPPADSTTAMTIKIGDIDLRDFTYRMRMVPTIDSLGANVARGRLRDGLIDMRQQLVKLGAFTGTGLNAAYVACDSAQIADNPVPVGTDVPATKPWTVEIDSIHFGNSEGLYTIRSWQPGPGLDFSYIQATDLDLTVRNFYNRATTLRLPIKLSGLERCGVLLNAMGTFTMDSTAMHFRDFTVSTSGTLLKADGELGVGDMLADPSLPMKLDVSGYLGFDDMRMMFPFAKAYLAGVPADGAVDLAADINGTAGSLDVNELNIGINHIVKIKGSGHIDNAFSPKGPDGNVRLWGNIIDPKSIMKAIDTGGAFTIPPMTLDGAVAMNHGNIKGNLTAETAIGGNLALDAQYLASKEGYDIELKTVEFPVNAIMSDLGIGKVTASLTVHGNGFDPMARSTNIDASASIHKLVYKQETIENVTADVNLHDGQGKISAHSGNKALDVTLQAAGNLSGETLAWNFTLDGRNIDLYALEMMPDEADLSVYATGEAKYVPATKNIAANVNLRTLDLTRPMGEINITDVKATFDAADSLVEASLTNRDLLANVRIYCSLDSLGAKLARATALLDREMAEYRLSPDSLQEQLPKFDIYVTAGRDNLVNDIMASSKMSMQSLRMQADNDSVIDVKAQLLGLKMSGMNVDTIGMRLTQNANRVKMVVKADNRHGTLDQFAHIRLDAMLNTNQVAVRAHQQNISGKTGFDIGALVSAADSTLNMRFFPLNPVIGYKPWTINLDNYLRYNIPHKHFDANLKMKGDNSSVELYTLHDESNPYSEMDDIYLKINDVQLADWIVINPFAPAITGTLSTDLKLQWEESKSINGTLTLADFTYDKQPVGTFVSNLDVAANLEGMVRAKADLQIDGKKAMELTGVLNDTTAVSPFDLDLAMIEFPLHIANPFLPSDMASLNGVLNGSMCVSGDMANPKLDGHISFQDAAVKLIMTNTSYRFSDVQIPVEQNVVKFNDFVIYGANGNPLTIAGTVNLSSFISPKIDLQAKADNMMLVNTNQATKNATVYGKAMIDLDASVKGNMQFMSVKVDLTVLNGTNVTYVMTDATSTMQRQSSADMVRWVNFSDSTRVIEADTIATESMMLLDANLTIQNGTTFNVDLSTTTRDKVSVQPEGSLTMTMSPLSDPRLTGRININGGLARYTIPVIGQEKSFTFDQGSYVAFNGDILNPVLNINATDVVKTNVTQTGQNSRLVNFNILLGITGTLAAMNVTFNLTTIDDMTIANELESMSAEQRANQAMNLLLYNVYTGPGVKASGNLSANPLFSFLESQVNNWAAQNIKGIDLSFGIDQYNQTTNGNTSTAMNYSYQVSKTLFNDRFKIVVGGNYTTDQNSDENLSESLISDISFEYFLNRHRTMLLKLFRHTGYESILEGEITKTGVGFVYRRKINNLVQILPRFMRPEKYKNIR